METAAVGLPSVFVPYPHGNGEQARNAAPVVDAGRRAAARRRRLHPGLGRQRRCPALLGDPDRLAAMTRALAGIARRDAATVLARRTLAVAAAVGPPREPEGGAEWDCWSPSSSSARRTSVRSTSSPSAAPG